MTPLERYQNDLKKDGFIPDKYQAMAVNSTQRLYEELLASQNHSRNIISRLFASHTPAIKGLYLWGGTGRGKTYLCDCLFECCETIKKNRVHFHRFMLDIHAQLELLQKSPEPLEVIAKKIANEIRVLFLDEFHVHDIADAMLMGGLLKALFKHGVVLVASSNIEISELYKNGLQRDRFMFAIELLKKNTEELNLNAGIDYRFRILSKNDNYYLIDDNFNPDSIQTEFYAVAPCTPKTNRSVTINNRDIEYIAMADDVIWFDFHSLCFTPRSAHDYIEIAKDFHTVFLTDVKVMHERNDAGAKRFVHLVDALYDHNVKLIMSAHASVNDLYRGERMKFAFGRTISRLVEMGTQEYLLLAHNPTGTVRIHS